MEDFNGKVAAVTGGASGIGRSLVKELLAAGASVVIGDVEQAALERVGPCPIHRRSFAPVEEAARRKR